MNPRNSKWSGALIRGCVLATLCAIGLQVTEANETPERSFARRVLPLLKEKCFACHGDDPADVRGELNMLSREGLLRGGESGEAAVVPGEPGNSPLYLAVLRDHELWSAMPPKENDRLTAEQVDTVRQWIADDAVWPDAGRLRELVQEDENGDEADTGVVVRTAGGLSGDWSNRRYEPENLWAYQPLARTQGPIDASDDRHRLDNYLQQHAKALGVELAPPADRVTLIRRATFDLLGLPPSAEETAAFVADPDTDEVAFARLVDRLLNSPHYGEQWGRHWLDVVRYADSSGYANDYERGSAWRYRDYVIRALNEDKPYDHFVREQIAGDEMVELADQRQTPLSADRRSELLVAVGFLRMGPWELTGMEVEKVARQRFLDDVTDAVGQVFLGQLLQCARCHDHKFDPVPTRDYYSIQAVFATTQLAERAAPFMSNENTSGFVEEQKYLRQRGEYYGEILAELDRKAIAAARQWYVQAGIDSTAFEAALRKGEQGSAGFDEARRTLLRDGVPEDRVPPRHAGFTPQDYGLERVARKGIERLKWRSDRFEPIALSVYSGRTPVLRSVNAPLRVPQDRMTEGQLEVTCILPGGDPFSPTDAVTPGILSVVPALMPVSSQGGESNGDPAASGQRMGALSVDDSIEGRRLTLADWIVSPTNPLTPRVMVNRIWQWHFGQALAGNPNNFGATGKKPTHPELLDWLAAKFIDEGWSIKAMHRLMMNSQAYRRSSWHPDAEGLARRDVQGTSYGAFQSRRLDAEELRDAMLMASGELNLDVGGIPIRPEMNLEAALQPRMVMGTFAEAWQPSPLPSQRHRRTVYAMRIRGQRDPFLEVFNAPSPDISCEAREASTVTPQVFALLNGQGVYQRALAMAQGLVNLQLDRRATIQRAFQLTFTRPAREREVVVCLEHWKQMEARHESLQVLPFEYPREVIREALEENTGEKFTFREPLEVHADFVADLKPSEATAQVRGLAEVCLVLFNSNEFAYIE